MTQHPAADETADELARLRAQLEAERAEFRSELAAGAAELDRRDRVVEKLREQRDTARAKVRLYEKSRVVRLAGKVVLASRRVRGIT